jgi:hypothetical protein
MDEVCNIPAVEVHFAWVVHYRRAFHPPRVGADVVLEKSELWIP